ncbi:MAG: glutamate 5-kinase [Candidatus Omnitrophica bacterium]|nr:glutamate 5-kinase [Candidatus Omnitrophota bacterium]
MRRELAKGKCWVIKVGTSTLTTSEGHFSFRQLENIVDQVAILLHKGVQVVLVSSGAIALGMDTLKRTKRPTSLPELQGCAAIGQGKLMKAYESAFSSHDYHAAQILLTRDGLQDRERYVNARNTLQALFQMGTVPIVNENDTVATEEIRFGDNDVLAAHVANLVEANLLVFLSDIDGLYLKDQTLIRQIHSAEELKEYTSHIYPKKSEMTSGGMKTKLEAAHMAMSSGIPIVLANGRDERVVERILKGEEVGSLFFPSREKASARKRWLAHSASSKGTVTLDHGAHHALTASKKSLLAGGVLGCSGNFGVGDVVELADEDGRVFARGLINYSRDEVVKIKGRKTKEIDSILGYKRSDELIHRNNLVLVG